MHGHDRNHDHDPSRPRDVYHREWRLGGRVTRTAVDLSEYPDLVVMYLGMRVRSLRGVPTLLGFLRNVQRAVDEKPEGLLRHERIVWSPRQLGWRQYWRDFGSLERWARSPPHADWWRAYLQDAKGTSFWHETYFLGGGFEAIYDNVEKPFGMMAFAPHEPAVGGMFTARRRLRIPGQAPVPPPVPEPPSSEPAE